MIGNNNIETAENKKPTLDEGVLAILNKLDEVIQEIKELRNSGDVRLRLPSARHIHEKSPIDR